METLDIIKELCEKKGISVSQLENKLEFGNGSLSKSKNMSADRLYQVAKFFDVSMEYMMTGKTIDEADDEMTKLRQQQSILMEINKVSQQMSEYYKKIAECQDRLSALKRDYNKLDSKGKVEPQKASEPVPDFLKIPDFLDEELPFN